MTYSGWIAVSALGVALLTEGGAPVALAVMVNDAIAVMALRIRENLVQGFTGSRNYCGALPPVSQPDNELPSRRVPHSLCVSTDRWRWTVSLTHVASIAPAIGASRYTQRKRVCPERAAGPNWRAGFTLPPVEVPSIAIARPIAPPTIQGTNGASLGTARQTPTRRTMTAILNVSATNSDIEDHPGPGCSTA